MPMAQQAHRAWTLAALVCCAAWTRPEVTFAQNTATPTQEHGRSVVNTWDSTPAPTERLDAMDRMLRASTEEGGSSTVSIATHLGLAAAYAGFGAHAMLHHDREWESAFFGTLSFGVSGIALGLAIFQLTAPSRPYVNRYHRFQSLRRSVAPTLRELRLIEGEVYEDVRDRFYARLTVRSLGAALFVVGGVVTGFAAHLHDGARDLAFIEGAFLAAIGGYYFATSFVPTDAEREWAKYRAGYLRGTSARSIVVAPYASSIGAGLLLNVQL